MDIRQQNFIGNEWHAAETGDHFPVTNPADNSLIGHVPNGNRQDARRAIDAAASALPAWRALTADRRARYLMAFHDALVAHRKPLAEILTREMGKPLRDAEGEIISGAKFFQWYAEEGKRAYGDVIPSPIRGRKIIVTKEPVGVVGAITPWNFPSSMIARKMSAALAAGCTMVLKPAPQTPYSALAYGDLALEAGLPAGVFNVITGDADAIGKEFCENSQIRKLTFTGSTAIGQKLASQAGANMKRYSMELGGHAPFIVFDDANLEDAINGALNSKFRNSGQTCICANRFFVQDGIYDAFIEGFVAKAKTLKIGDGMNPATDQGPLINPNAVEKVEAHIRDATQKGGKIATGGQAHQAGSLFFEPTIITEATHDMTIAEEETFGPVAPIFRFTHEDDVIARANDTQYGLACYVFTQNLGRAFRLSDQLEYGMVGINEGMVASEVAPFGGVKSSGIGREGSKYGLEDYLNIKFSLFGGLAR